VTPAPMHAKPVIALVGGIGSGKSRVATEMARHGGRVVAGDVAGHEVLRAPVVRDRVVELFGRAVLGPDGEIARKKVAAIVFNDAEQRRRLEAVMFPHIGRRLLRQIDAARADPSVRFVVLDAAVLLEADWNSGVDWLVYVHAPRHERLRRLAAQRRWDSQEVEARERAQLSLTEKAARADFAVDNSGTSEELAAQVTGVLRACGIEV
jgi:dephospho-CoA kinase